MAVTVAAQNTLSLTTGSKSAEQVTGTYQYIPRGTLQLFAKQSAAAATGIRCTLQVAGTPLVDDAYVPFAGATGSLSVNDNQLISQKVGGGRVSLTFRNDSAGTLTVDYLLVFTPG